MQERLENAFAALVLGPALEASSKHDVQRWLEARGIAGEDADAMLAGGIERLLLYRKLVRHTLKDTLELAIPRAMARLGPLFDEYFDRFLAEIGPRSHYLRDVTTELLDFAEPLWKRDDRVAPYIAELARHEALRIEIGSMPAPRYIENDAALELNDGVAFAEATRLVHYRHAVHELSDDPADRTAPAVRDAWLFVYRSPEHEVRYLELTPLAAAIVERLLAGDTLGSAIQTACSERAQSLDPGVLDGAARLLADLAERGVLLGSTRTSPQEDHLPTDSRLT
jgi:hypothetical protein